MVTEQVKRVSAAVRAAGFKRGEFSCRAEVKRIRERDTGRTYSQFGPAVATFHTMPNNYIAYQQAENMVEQGVIVEVFFKGGYLWFVAVREPKLNEKPKVIKRDWEEEQAESDRLLGS